MDRGPEASHVSLLGANLPSTIEDMKNPTAEYIMNLLTQFLTKFNIDVSAIKKPTFDQLNLWLAEDSPDILSVVNLSEVMASISERIFVKDFHLTDITSPVPKRSRRYAQLMANFLLYANGKMAEIEERLEESRLKYARLQEIRNENMALREATNAQALRISKKLELKAQVEAEVAKLKMRKEERQLKIKEAETQLNNEEQKKSKAEQRHANLEAKLLQTKQKLKKTQSKFVQSPERHNALLRDLTKEMNEKCEKRAVIEEALKSKKPAIDHIESCLNFVRQEHAKFNEFTEVHKHFAECKKIMAQGLYKVAELKAQVEQESRAGTEENYRVNALEFSTVKAQVEEHLSGIRNRKEELSAHKNDLEKTIKDSHAHLEETLSERDKIQALIVKKELDCKKLIQITKEIYDAEIKKELEMNDRLEKTLGAGS